MSYHLWKWLASSSPIYGTARRVVLRKAVLTVYGNGWQAVLPFMELRWSSSPIHELVPCGIYSQQGVSQHQQRDFLSSLGTGLTAVRAIQALSSLIKFFLPSRKF